MKIYVNENGDWWGSEDDRPGITEIGLEELKQALILEGFTSEDVENWDGLNKLERVILKYGTFTDYISRDRAEEIHGSAISDDEWEKINIHISSHIENLLDQKIADIIEDACDEVAMGWNRFEAWALEYQPFTNQFNDGAGYGGYLFDTEGEEFVYVKAHDLEQVWTLCEEGGDTFIQSGLRLANRLGHFITQKRSEEFSIYNI